MKLKIIVILIFAVLIAIATRFYMLGEAPAGLYLDEAGQGYSAYSILKTGKDEFGKAYPAVFRSFTDFKTPVYIYLIVPLIPLFGLTKFTVRFPSFIFSILTIPLIYLLINKIASKKYALPISLISSLLIAISPWHILFGRTNFECNVALFLFLLGTYLFYLALESPKYFIASAIFFALAIPAYHAQRVVTPLMLIALAFKYRKRIFISKNTKYLLISSILGFLILLPTFTVMRTPGFLARAAGLNIFSLKDKTPAGYIENYQGPFSNVINSPLFLTTKEFSSLYLSYFSPRQMFVLGDYGPRSSYPYLATFFLWQFPFYLAGLYYLIKQKKLGGDLKFFVISLLLISPIPAAVTRDPYSSIRSLQMLIPQNIIISLGIYETYFIFKKKISLTKKRIFYFNKALVLFFIALGIYSILKLYSSAIILNEYYRAREWNYGWEQVVNALNKYPNLPVVVDNAREGAYIQLLFFTQFDPATYQENNFEVTTNDYYTNMIHIKDKKIGRIETRAIDWKPDIRKKQILVGDSLAISPQQIKEHHLSLLEEIYYPNGELAFIVVETNPQLIEGGQ